MEEYLRTMGKGPEKLLHFLQLSHHKRALISCSLGGNHSQEAVGLKLQRNHAYTITGFTKVKTTTDILHYHYVGQVRGGRKGKLLIPLVRLRDPHGGGVRAEWQGDWGDDSAVWQEIPAKMRKRIRSMENDGEFFMSFNKDFIRYFSEISMIHLNPLRLELNEERQTRKFQLADLRGEWRAGEAGATTSRGYQDFHKNPQFVFSVSNCRDGQATCPLVVSLSQQMQDRSGTKPSIGFVIYKNCPSGRLDASFVRNALNIQGDSGDFINTRDVSKSFLLPAGSYVIMPSTFERQGSGGFQLRLWVDSRWRCRLPQVDGGGHLTTVRDYTSTARAARRCNSFWRMLLCCRCYCCCLPD